ncbi:methyltransferase-like protein 17, mitochondrial [Boleophthalmus pectinirostris]|uniref:methyltransferase-like protein 17, mitochondrial n=1 Tax=Boleophthalmus pectinirostris TaxID=150288 RepID=UPI002430B1C3|nr:methyltransferase-like protein 17, mitochondrial [Boleophthalmus pectinirostris]
MALRSFSACGFCHRVLAVKTTLRGMSTAAKLQPHADFLNGAPHRKHPGVTNLKTLRLPEKLQVAARSIIHRAQIKGLDVKAQNLVDFLWSRKRKMEDKALRQKALNLERELWSKVTEKQRDVDEQLLEERIQKKVLSELRRTTYHWKQLKFDEEMGVIYMAARLAGGYAAVRRALNEIKKRDTSFAPESLLDFGSGLGTVAWASHSCWPDSLKEMVCVDSSGPMNTLAERLLKGDNEKEEPHFKHVYFRQFLPVSPKVQFDLVVAAFTLSELPKAADREDVVLTLWRKTNRYLVLVENGTKEGHQMLMEARDTLLNKQEKIVHDFRPASVFAPCPHEMMCPKLTKEPVFPCNFQQKYHTLSLPGQISHLTEKFSYLILTRADPKSLVPGLDSGLDPGLDWARLIAPVLPRTRHVHCRMCCTDGQLQHVVVTPRKHGRDVYRCARSSDWGDQIPVVQITDSEDHSESEEQ